MALATVVLAGCGEAGEAPPLTAAELFHRHLDVGDAQAACALLSPGARHELESSTGKPCAEALPAEKVPVAGDVLEVSRFGSMAQVRYAGEVVFLGRFPDGWRVTAAGCTPAAGGVYECQVGR